MSMTTGKCIKGLIIGAAAGGLIGAAIDNANKSTKMARMGKKMLKKCTGILSDIL